MNLVKLVENINLYRARKIVETIPNYIDSLTLEGFGANDIDEVRQTPTEEQMLLIWSKFNIMTAGQYNDIDSIRTYMNTHLTPSYKTILLTNLEKYDAITNYHVSLQ